MILTYSSDIEGIVNVKIQSLSIGFAALTMFAAAQTTFAARELSPLCQAANAVQNVQILASLNDSLQLVGVGYAGETYNVQIVEASHPYFGSFYATYIETDTNFYVNQDGFSAHAGDNASFTLTGDHELLLDLWYYGFPGDTVNVTVTCTAGPTVTGCGNVTDGRLNSSAALDCAAPVAVYWSDAGLDVYSVNPDNGDGVFTVRLTQAEIDASVGTVLLSEIANPYTGATIRVYKLEGGLIQINTIYADGKEYTIQFDHAGMLNHVAA
jgi:hypothetical protein